MDLNEIGRLAKAAQPSLQKSRFRRKKWQDLHRAAELLSWSRVDFLFERK